jgi:hypothetical protein
MPPTPKRSKKRSRLLVHTVCLQAVQDAKVETALPAQKTVGKPDPPRAQRLLTFLYYKPLEPLTKDGQKRTRRLTTRKMIDMRLHLSRYPQA